MHLQMVQVTGEVLEEFMRVIMRGTAPKEFKILKIIPTEGLVYAFAIVLVVNEEGVPPAEGTNILPKGTVHDN